MLVYWSGELQACVMTILGLIVSQKPLLYRAQTNQVLKIKTMLWLSWCTHSQSSLFPPKNCRSSIFLISRQIWNSNYYLQNISVVFRPPRCNIEKRTSCEITFRKSSIATNTVISRQKEKPYSARPSFRLAGSPKFWACGTNRSHFPRNSIVCQPLANAPFSNFDGNKLGGSVMLFSGTSVWKLRPPLIRLFTIKQWIFLSTARCSIYQTRYRIHGVYFLLLPNTFLNPCRVLGLVRSPLTCPTACLIMFGYRHSFHRKICMKS